MKAIYSSPLIPPEWIAAHGWRPSRLSARPATEAPPIGTCPFAWAWMLSALSEPDASCIILTTDCVQMRHLAETLATRTHLPVFRFNIPRASGSAGAQKIYRSELERLGRFLVHFGGHAPSSQALEDIIHVHADLRRQKPQTRSSGIPLALFGGHLMPQHAAIHELIGRAGGSVVLDATETGEISLPAPPDPDLLSRDPLGALVRMYYASIPSVHRSPHTALYEWLGLRLAQRPVRGIIHVHYTWCDSWHAEVRRMEEWSPIPWLPVALSPNDSFHQQFVPHIQAFLETLR